MPEPVTTTTFITIIAISALKGVFSNKDWGFDSVEASVAGAALNTLKKILGKFSKQKELRQQLIEAAKAAREWLDTRPEFRDIWPVISAVCAEEWPELSEALGDIQTDLSGSRLRSAIRKIFTVSADEEKRDLAAEAFYEALVRAMIQVPAFAQRAQILLLDMSHERRDRVLADLGTMIDARFAALIDPKKLVRWPYDELPTDGERLSDLLRAEYGVVPFFGRESEINDALAWCDRKEPVAARLYLGDGGEGKTRYFSELCARLIARDGMPWSAGFLLLGRALNERARLDALLGMEGGVLLGIDYAGSELSRVLAFAEHLSSGHWKARVRVILLERDAGHWWETAKAESGVFAHAEKRILQALGEPAERTSLFDDAFNAFREVIPGAESDSPAVGLEADEFSNVLFIHMAAALIAAGDPAPAAGNVLDRMLLHERKWRQRRAETLSSITDGESLELAAAIGTLVGGVKDFTQSAVLLRRTVNFKDFTDHELEKLCRTLGGFTHGTILPALKPDRLGERLLENIFLEEDSAVTEKLLNAVFAEQDSADLLAGFKTLDRMAWRDIEAHWLKVLAAGPLPSDLPQKTLELLDFALLLTGIALFIKPKMFVGKTDQKAQEALWQNNLANRLSDIGEYDKALVSVSNAIGLYRELASVQPEEFLPYLAGCLANSARFLSLLSKMENSLTAAEESMKIYLDLSSLKQGTFLPELAMSQYTLSKCYLDQGRLTDALSLAMKSVEVFRALSSTQPNSYRWKLAASLDGMTTILSAMHRYSEALLASKESIVLYRCLSKGRPDSFLADLAGSINNLATIYSDLDLQENALDAIEESVEINRKLVEVQPIVYRPRLAGALRNLSHIMSRLGRHEDSATVADESVQIFRDLAMFRQESFRPELAASLNTLSNSFFNLGRREEALAATEEATDLYRELTSVSAHVFQPYLAKSLVKLASQLSDLEQFDRARVISTEVVELYRELASARPDDFRPDLATSLGTLGRAFSAAERHEVAAGAFYEGIRTLFPYFRGLPQAFRQTFVALLKSYLESCAKAGAKPDEALMAEVSAFFETLKSD